MAVFGGGQDRAAPIKAEPPGGSLDHETEVAGEKTLPELDPGGAGSTADGGRRFRVQGLLLAPGGGPLAAEAEVVVASVGSGILARAVRSRSFDLEVNLSSERPVDLVVSGRCLGLAAIPVRLTAAETEGSSRLLILRFEEGARIRARAARSDGAAVRSVDYLVREGPPPPEAGPLKVADLGKLTPVVSIEKGEADGSLDVVVRTGTVSVMCRTAGGGFGPPVSAVVRAGDVVDLGILTVGEGGQPVLVRVIDEAGAPVSGALIRFEDPMLERGATGIRSPLRNLRCDRNGLLEIESVSGDAFPVRGAAGSSEHIVRAFVIPRGLSAEEEHVVRLKKLPRVRVRFEPAGRVLDMENLPLELRLGPEGKPRLPSPADATARSDPAQVLRRNLGAGPFARESGSPLIFAAAFRESGKHWLTVRLGGAFSHIESLELQEGESPPVLVLELPGLRQVRLSIAPGPKSDILAESRTALECVWSSRGDPTVAEVRWRWQLQGKGEWSSTWVHDAHDTLTIRKAENPFVPLDEDVRIAIGSEDLETAVLDFEEKLRGAGVLDVEVSAGDPGILLPRLTVMIARQRDRGAGKNAWWGLPFKIFMTDALGKARLLIPEGRFRARVFSNSIRPRWVEVKPGAPGRYKVIVPIFDE